MDIGLDLQRAYDDGYKKGWEEAEAYALHCGDETPITNADRIRIMSDEELARFLFREEPWCTFERECEPSCETCIENWLKEEVKDG